MTINEKVTIEKVLGALKITKGDLLVKQGKICDQVAFVFSGKLRNYFINDNENEVTCLFVKEDNFVSAFTSFLTNTPTH